MDDGELTDPGVGDFELAQYVLRHVVLGGRVDDEVLVASRAFCGPVLVTLLLHPVTDNTTSVTGLREQVAAILTANGRIAAAT